MTVCSHSYPRNLDLYAFTSQVPGLQVCTGIPGFYLTWKFQCSRDLAPLFQGIKIPPPLLLATLLSHVGYFYSSKLEICGEVRLSVKGVKDSVKLIPPLQSPDMLSFPMTMGDMPLRRRKSPLPFKTQGQVVERRF